jgi:hypothetical protein
MVLLGFSDEKFRFSESGELLHDPSAGNPFSFSDKKVPDREARPIRDVCRLIDLAHDFGTT